MHSAAAFDVQFNFCVQILNDKLSCHNVLYDTSIEIGCLNNGAQFNKCGPKEQGLSQQGVWVSFGLPGS